MCTSSLALKIKIELERLLRVQADMDDDSTIQQETQRRLNRVMYAVDDPVTLDEVLAVFQQVHTELSAASKPLFIDLSAFNALYAQELSFEHTRIHEWFSLDPARDFEVCEASTLKSFADFLLLFSDTFSEVAESVEEQAKVYAYFARHGALADLVHGTADGLECYESAAIVLAQSDLEPTHAGLCELREDLCNVRKYLEKAEQGEGDGTHPLQYWTPAMRAWLSAVPDA